MLLHRPLPHQALLAAACTHRRALLPLLAKYGVPLPRAAWLVKLTHWRRSSGSSGAVLAAAPTAADQACSQAWTSYLLAALAAAAAAAPAQGSAPFVTTPPQAPAGDVAGAGDTGGGTVGVVDPGVQLAYGVRLGCYTFSEGMVDLEALIDWAAAQLTRADAPTALQRGALLLAMSCKEVRCRGAGVFWGRKRQVLSAVRGVQVHARAPPWPLGPAQHVLTDPTSPLAVCVHNVQELAAGASMASKLAAALVLLLAPASGEHEERPPPELGELALQLLEALLLLCPTNLLGLDCMPQLLAAVGAPQACVLGAQHEPASAARASMTGSRSTRPVVVANAGSVVALSQRLAASVAPPLLSFQPAEGLKGLWRALAGGDVDAGWRVVEACLGG